MARSVSEQIEWEARAGRVAAGAAVLSLVLFVGGTVYGLTAVERRQPRTIGDLGALARDPFDFILPAVIAGIAFALVGVVLGFLYRATKYRRPQLPSAAFALLVFGALGTGVTVIAQNIDFVNAAQSLSVSGANARAPVLEELRGRVSLQVIAGLNLGGRLALGLATVLISVAAIRAGLMSLVLGILGVVAALSQLLPLLLLQVLFILWLGALAALFVDRWPGGRGPAWPSGEALPWPGAAQRNAEIDRRKAAAEVGEREGADASSEASPDGDSDTHTPDNGGPPANSRQKRKRGRRR